MAVSATLQKLFLSLACLLAVSTVALAQTANPWLSIQANNMQIVGNVPESNLRATGIQIDEFRRLLTAIFPDLNKRRKALRVVVFPDQAAYTPFKPKKADGTADDGVRGYFAAGGDVDYIALAAGADADLGTLRHEFAHAFFKANFDQKFPLWLNEGLAEYFETARINGDNTILLGSIQNEHLKLLRKRGLQPLPTFFCADEQTLTNGGDTAREQFYAQAWLTVHYLFQSGRLTTKDLPDKVSKFTSGKNAAETTITDTIGLGYLTLEQELGGYLRQKVLSTISVPVSPAAPAASMPTATDVSDASANAYLGDLLLHIDNAASAETFLRKALTLDPNSALANETLGLLLMEKDRTDEAVKHLEKAIAAGTTSHVALFQYAYALNLQSADKNGEISVFGPDAAKKMRDALERSIRYAPGFAESYRLLAFTYFVNGDDLDRADSLIRRAVSLQPDDPEFELLLARILLAREKYTEARPYAERLSKLTAVPKVKSEAEEVLRAIDEYDHAKAAPTNVDLKLSNFVFPQLIFLKRSWLTGADVEQIEKSRAIANVNRFLIRPLPGETQIAGRIEKVTCRDGDITYNILTSGGTLRLTSKGFQNLRMTVLTPGESSFEIGCDAHLEKQLAVINYRQPDNSQAGSKGEIRAISFVPDDFRLLTLEELGAMRTVVLEDDTLHRAGSQVISASPEAERLEARVRSIIRSLRQPQTGETRITGRVERIDCNGGRTTFHVSAGEKAMRFMSVGSELKLGWFTVASTEIPIVCGAESLNSKAVLTYRSRTSLPAGIDGELRSLEFVPEEFELR